MILLYSGRSKLDDTRWLFGINRVNSSPKRLALKSYFYEKRLKIIFFIQYHGCLVNFRQYWLSMKNFDRVNHVVVIDNPVSWHATRAVRYGIPCRNPHIIQKLLVFEKFIKLPSKHLVYQISLYREFGVISIHTEHIEFFSIHREFFCVQKIFRCIENFRVCTENFRYIKKFLYTSVYWKFQQLIPLSYRKYQ